jgi:hypothetical protein
MGKPNQRGGHYKGKVLALVDRTTGKARAQVVDRLSKKDLEPIIRANVAKEARMMTDEATYYLWLADAFAEHQSVNHGAGEYVRGEAHTNTLEGFFSIFKRGMKGVYQHCAHRHLHRYVAEFEFRYNNRSALGVEDRERARAALAGAAGKRLKYNPADRRP